MKTHKLSNSNPHIVIDNSAINAANMLKEKNMGFNKAFCFLLVK